MPRNVLVVCLLGIGAVSLIYGLVAPRVSAFSGTFAGTLTDEKFGAIFVVPMFATFLAALFFPSKS